MGSSSKAAPRRIPADVIAASVAFLIALAVAEGYVPTAARRGNGQGRRRSSEENRGCERQGAACCR